MSDIGRMLILGGLFLIGVGLAITILGKVPGLGKLPGDMIIKKGNFSFYFPLTTCLLLSGIISLVLYLWQRK